MKDINKLTTIVICCAGKGSRLKKHCPKALIDISGKPMIAHQLDAISGFDDVRVVVGYQADRVTEYLNTHYPYVSIVYNAEYETTSAGDSIVLGIKSRKTKKNVVAMVGDILINGDDFQKFVKFGDNCIAGCSPESDNPIFMVLDDNDNCISFSRDKGQMEWLGLIKVEAECLNEGRGTLYNTIKPYLPIKVLELRAKEIDTPHDYERVLSWYNKRFM